MNRVSRTLLALAIIVTLSSVCVFADTNKDDGVDDKVSKYLEEYNELMDNGNDDPEKFKANGFYYDDTGNLYIVDEDGERVIIKAGESKDDTEGSSTSKTTTQSSSLTDSPFMGYSYTHKPKYSNRTLKHGVDVSYYQGIISVSQWEQAKSAGVEFAIIRVAYRGALSGTLNEDIYYRENIANAREAGIKVGAYIYSQAITTDEGREEANYILERIKPYKLDLPVVFDYEYFGKKGRLNNAHLSQSEKTSIAEAFCDRVKSKGYTPMVYANVTFLHNDVDGKALSDKYPVWVAQYPGPSNGRACDYLYGYDFWQYTSSGSVNGLPGRIDCNFWYDDGTVYNRAKNKPTKVKGLKVKKHSTNYIKISWDKATYRNEAVDGYRIYRSTRYDGTYKRIASVKADTREYTDSNRSQGREYYYKVRAYVKKSSGGTVTGSKSKALTAKTRSAYRKTCTVKMDSCLRSHPGTSYSVNTVMKKGSHPEVYRYAIAKNGKKWYRVKYVKSGSTYYGYVSARCLNVNSSTKVKKVTGISKTTAEHSYVNVRWNRQKNVKGYVIYRSTSANGRYTKIGIRTSENKHFRDKTIKPGRKYYYKVRAYARNKDKNYFGDFSNMKTVVIAAE